MLTNLIKPYISKYQCNHFLFLFPLEYDQVKTIAEQRIYLDEAHELHELLADKWVQALLEVGYLPHHHGYHNDHRYHFMIATILENDFQDVMIIRKWELRFLVQQNTALFSTFLRPSSVRPSQA